eukprot:5084521-Amphidinium_carterae.1
MLVFKNTSDSMFILSYVDDLLILGEESEVNAFITALEKGDSWVIRVSDRDLNDGELHERSNSVSAPGVKTPALPEPGNELLHFTDHKKFRTAIGKLQ